ncbi:MAG: DPP IV N-terminal domain-containing protein, partial [Anaerolineales bacterium]|nr:DPP IV N-terminal domain-containing protein [Anaerolineales bacterium]
MKKSSWLIIVLLLLAACGSQDEPTPTAVSPTAARTETVVVEDVQPTDTAVPAPPTSTPRPTVVPPTPQSRPTRPPVTLPTATPAETEAVAPQAADVPELVWLPYASGNFGEPVLMVEDGEMATQELPVAVEIYFDYANGWLAYGSYFWEATANQQSVTDLHLYDFATGEETLWAEQVGRAAITPQVMFDGPPSVAAAVHSGQGFDLVLIRGAENRTVLVDDIDPYFSWSPDGSQIAYLRDNNLFVTDVVNDFGNPAIATGVYANSGWIGDAPLWLGNSGYLL